MDIKDERKNVKVSKEIKNMLERVKHEAELKSESDVIGYLCLYYTSTLEKLPYKQHKELLKKLDEIKKQMIL